MTAPRNDSMSPPPSNVGSAATAKPARKRKGTSGGTPFPYMALISIAVALFISITVEMLPVGLLPEMSEGLNVPESLTGITVSIFAFTAVLTAAYITYLTRRVERRLLIITMLALFAVSTIITALAPNYEVLVASRILGGGAAGVFWSVSGAYAAYLVPKEQLGRAIAISSGGGSMAFIFGVPLGVALGHAVGWRWSFGILAIVALLGIVFVLKFLPRVQAGAATPTNSIPVVSTATDGSPVVTVRDAAPAGRQQSVMAVVFVCIITAVMILGQYTFYTYVTPYLVEVVGLDPAGVAPALFAYGVTGLVALTIVGLWLGSRPRRGLIIGMIGVIGGVLTLGLAPQVLPLALAAFLIWGISQGMVPPLLQTRLLRAAPASIRDVSNAFMTTAFNAGIGGGALIGALALEGVGLAAIPFLHVGMVVVALVLVLVADAILHRGTPKSLRD